MDKKQAFKITKDAISKEIQSMKNNGSEVDLFEEAYNHILFLMCKILAENEDLEDF